jgi:hypothetical protein
MIAYKLLTKRKDGTLGPLFINRKQRIPIGVWLESEHHPTKGYKDRQGWHCTKNPVAPHLHTKNRRWYQVEIEDVETLKRPEAQGGVWFLAQRMRVLEECY